MTVLCGSLLQLTALGWCKDWKPTQDAAGASLPNAAVWCDVAEPVGPGGVAVLDRLVLWRPPPKDYHLEELRSIDR
ncbi:hypothetical protein HPB48_001909 [Haemaphysalis longicornis]|uniref:Secreted protein n=1 Tax=Haemaphysalis longicornis TaxID=44386 RepID=A0A9J6G680_HAELO|nr:hypothetical protein HPB48_001909 [Haemaphysalis longicornis]